MDKDNPVFKVLLAANEEFQRLYEEHSKYELQLEELDKNHYLTPEQEIQRKTIQKLKLNGKDRMTILMDEAQHKQHR